MCKLCVLAEAADKHSTLCAQLARVSLKPAAGPNGKEHSTGAAFTTVRQESQTDHNASHSSDAGVQCSPITVNTDTAVTDCRIVSLITFSGSFYFMLVTMSAAILNEFMDVFMLSLPDNLGEGIMFSGCPSTMFVCPFICSSGQILFSYHHI